MFADPAGELRGVVTADSLQAVLDHYQAGDWRAQRVVVTGDLIQDDSDAAYQRFVDMLLTLQLPVHTIPGNHDVRGRMQEYCSRPPFAYCARETIGDWLLVGLDSCAVGEAGGTLPDDEIARLEAAIEQSPAQYAAVFLHHPPVAMGSRWLDSVGLENGEAVLARLQQLPSVRLLAFGHVHQAYDQQHDNVRVIATPSTCRQFAPASDDFAVDDRPPAYRRLTLRANGEIGNKLEWVKL